MKKLLLTMLASGLAGACFAQTQSQKLDELITAYTNLQEFRGTALVAIHGQVLLEKGYGLQNITAKIPNTPNTEYEIASVTKTFTSALIIKLSELKKLNLNDRLSKYYPNYPHGDSITIRQLLSHTAGIYDYTHNEDLMFHHAGEAHTEKQMLNLFENQPLDFAPGTGWSYSNSGYSLLGYIISKVTGLAYQEAIRKYIFYPLSMQHSGFDFKGLDSAYAARGYYDPGPGKDYHLVAPLVDSTVTLSAGSIYATAGDLYKWHLGLQQNKIITAKDIEMAYTTVRNHYGYGWIIDTLYGHRMVSHSGGIFGFRSNFARVPQDDICIVLLSNTETPSLDELTKAIVGLLYDKPYQIPVKKHVVNLPELTLIKDTGTYIVQEKSLKIEVKLENGNLVTYPYHGPRSELAATDATHFFIKNQENFEVIFEQDISGKTTGFKFGTNGDMHHAERL